ncbi:MAG: amidohydrolase family protein [Kordiimonadaceae bacterium]|nr:amidohydrolase family protein [Kordiimonadaceae bacterium]
MVDRRDFLLGMGAGVGGSVAVLGTASMASAVVTGEVAKQESNTLYEEIITMPVDDSHCHPLTEQDAKTTPDQFLERISLAAMPAFAYFPDGVFDQWKTGDAALKHTLDKKYGIKAKMDEINYHFSESVFAKYMVKEMAGFLGCKPDIKSVIGARNERGGNYWGYIGDMFRDIKLENAMVDTGYAEGMETQGILRFEKAIKPTKVRRIYRVETIQSDLLELDISFEELETRFLQKVRAGLDGTANYGGKSYGMKSYLMPTIGVVKPLYDADVAKQSWAELKSESTYEDRQAESLAGKDLQRYLLTLAQEECLKRDMPMQYHAGDGEAPSIILRQQDPYNLEEVVRFDKDGVMRMPKIVPIHAGYPLVGQAAWLSHLYTNCYFELSIMTPFVHQGLLQRYLQVMEAVPLSKILFGSDAYHVPELYWLAGTWGKRYLSQALGVYVHNKLLTVDEALEAARMILYKNNRRLYNIDA